MTAEELKKKGNDYMKEQKFVEAMWQYTEALQLDKKNHLLYSNRSLAFLKMQNFHSALEDAKHAIAISPQWAKGYFRKGEVEYYAEHYEEAITSYTQAMIRDKDDRGIQEALSKARRGLHSFRKKQSYIPIYGTCIALGLGILVIVADAVLSKTSSVHNLVLRILIIAVFGALGYGLSISYRYIMQSQRKSLLEEPLDLLEAMGQGSSKTDLEVPDPDESKGQRKENVRHRKSSAANAKKKFQKGRS